MERMSHINRMSDIIPNNDKIEIMGGDEKGQEKTLEGKFKRCQFDKKKNIIGQAEVLFVYKMKYGPGELHKWFSV